MFGRAMRATAVVLLAGVPGFALSCKSATSGGTTAPSVGAACGASIATHPSGGAWQPAVDPSGPVSASFAVTIDPSHASLASEWLQPHPEAIAIAGGASGLRLVGGVKRFAKHPERLWVELYVVNDAPVGVAAATATVRALAGTSTFYDLTSDPLAAPSAPKAITLGGIAALGTSTRLRFAVDADTKNSPISLSIDLAGTTTARQSTVSSPIAITSDGSEAWAAFADSGVVAVIDTNADARVAQVAVPGRPSSVAITPDGALVLVTTSDCNQLVVIDRAKRTIVQSFGEADGIGRDPRNVVVSPDGTRAFVSAYVGDSVTALRRMDDGFAIASTIPVGRRPAGLSLPPDGHTLFVSHFLPRGPLRDNEGWISIVDADAFTPAGESVIRDDENQTEAQCVTKISSFAADAPTDVSFEAVPTQLAGAFLDPGGATAWVPGLRVAPFPILEGNLTGTGFDFLVKGTNSPLALFPLDARDPRSMKPEKLPSVADITDRDESFLACGDWAEEVEATTAFPIKDEPTQEMNSGSVLPSGSTPISETGVSRFVGFARGGRRVLLLSYAADEIMVVDAATHHPTTQHHFQLGGSNPIGIAVTPDGTKGYVAYENSTFASVVDLTAYADPTRLEPAWVPYKLDYSNGAGQAGGIVTFGAVVRETSGVPDVPPITETKQIALVDADPMDPVMRRGKVLFTSSNPAKYPTLSGSREASCSSCHPNGGNDGSVWGTMEGERRTIALWGGTAGRGWLHASATHQDSAAFATIIVKERLGGTGLSDADVNALASYVAHGIPVVQAPVVDDALAAKGKAIFESKCTSCHAGDKRTSGAPDMTSAYGGGDPSGPGLFDVGSATPWAGAVLGAPYSALFPPKPKQILADIRGDRDLGAKDPLASVISFEPRPDRPRGSFKAPPLVNEWENVVFFHDGRAASLEDAIRDISAKTGASVSDADVKALAEYLKTQ